MARKSSFWLILIAIGVDLIAYNSDRIPAKVVAYPPTLIFCYGLPQSTQNTIFFTGEALAWCIVYLIISILTKELFEIHLIASSYLGICINNLSDELRGDNIQSYFEEYIFLYLTITYVIYKLHTRKYPNHTISAIVDNLKSSIAMWMFK